MMSKLGWMARAAMALAAFTICGAAWAQAYVDGGWNMPVGVTEISREVYRLHMWIFWICVVIAVVVFGVMFYSIWAHRRSRHPKPADFHESTTVEIAWTVVPFLILVFMAVPAAGVLIRMEDVRGSELSVKVTGYQWKWHYEYLDHGVGFFSNLDADSNRARQLNSGIDPASVPNYLVNVDRPLVLPTERKVRFLITANDVYHAWWVPDLGVKKDAIPGFINEIWARIDTPGTYRGVCAELCGRDHGFMPVVVKAVPPQEFDAWLAGQKAGAPEQVAAAQPAPPTSQAVPNPPGEPAPATAPETPGTTPQLEKDELLARGKDVYAANCAACHQANGAGMPPNFPALVGSAVANGPAEEHVRLVLNGRNLMTGFGHLSDMDLAAVVTYERLSWGNKGSVVQPSDVGPLRK